VVAAPAEPAVSGGLAAVAAAVTAACAASLLLPADRGRARRREPPPASAALTLDLVAACLRGGAGLPAALRAAAAALSAGADRWCTEPADALAGGTPAQVAFADWLALPAWAPAARVLIRTSATGAPIADALRGLASRTRAELAHMSILRARRRAVTGLAPLVCCFLPAFVLLAVVPLVLTMLQALRGH
jgi:hypothetical protein